MDLMKKYYEEKYEAQKYEDSILCVTYKDVSDKAIAQAKIEGKVELWGEIENFGLIKATRLKGYVRLNDKQVEIIKKRQGLEQLKKRGEQDG